MAKSRSIKKVANDSFASSNDNGNNRFLFTVSDEQKVRALNPPTDNTVVDILHGVPVSDPFRPLENMDAQETKEWTDRQNKKFEDYLSEQKATTEAAETFFKNAMSYDEAGVPARYGDIWVRTFRSGLNDQSVLQTADNSKGPWETIIDPNQINPDGTTALMEYSLSADGKRLIYGLSEAGSDAQTHYIMDLGTKQIIDKIEQVKFLWVVWDKDSHDSFQYLYSLHHTEPRTVMKHHIIGRPSDQDPIVHESSEKNSYTITARLPTSKYDWAYVYIGTEPNNGLSFKDHGSTEPFKEIVAPKQYKLFPFAELDDGTVLAATNKDSPYSRIIKFNPHNPDPATWETIIPEHETDALIAGEFEEIKPILHQGKLIIPYTHDCVTIAKVFTIDGAYLYNVPFPVQSAITRSQNFSPEDKTLLFSISGFQSAGDIYSYDVEKNELSLFEEGTAKYNLRDCIVERLYATSKDGTKIPMTVIRHPDTKLDGTAATILYGYGGFGLPLEPSFSENIVYFVKSGGIFVQANLRGGGEFGREWYEQGRLKNKQNTFSDFIACAEHLQKEKYTSNKRLVINGGSNGGLSTSATVVQRPDLFGAAITEVSVTDIFRFHLGNGPGGNWRSDYGDPDVKEDFDISAKYSPLHNIKSDEKYPPHLIMTADHDDRVYPWHSFKLAATIQAKSDKNNVTLLRVEKDASHGQGIALKKLIQKRSEKFAFIEKAIGPVNQAAYKASLKQKKTPRKKKTPANDK